MISPVWVLTRPRIFFTSVVLPVPLSPTSPKISPRRSVKLSSCRTVWSCRRPCSSVSRYQLVRCLTSKTRSSMALTSAHAARNGVDELGGVGVLRRGEKLLGRALLNDVTALHHGNARAD